MLWQRAVCLRLQYETKPLLQGHRSSRLGDFIAVLHVLEQAEELHLNKGSSNIRGEASPCCAHADSSLGAGAKYVSALRLAPETCYWTSSSALAEVQPSGAFSVRAQAMLVLPRMTSESKAARRPQPQGRASQLTNPHDSFSRIQVTRCFLTSMFSSLCSMDCLEKLADPETSRHLLAKCCKELELQC